MCCGWNYKLSGICLGQKVFPFYCRLQEIYIKKAEKKILKKLKLEMIFVAEKKTHLIKNYYKYSLNLSKKLKFYIYPEIRIVLKPKSHMCVTRDFFYYPVFQLVGLQQ